ncbi:MAG TPA: fatty acid desaturase [Aliiroseovarius sp.]|nr:fatty acid desaturase [Aliiroseovarius sp.]
MNLRDATRQYALRSNFLASLSFFGNFAVYFLALFLGIRYFETWSVSVLAVLLLALAAVRLYVLQHDTGHLTLFRTRRQNEWAGYALSTFTFTPFRAMQYNHNLHHAYIGNLDARDKGEINTMTLREWQAASPGQRLFYRLYRNPVLLIGVGSVWTYFFRYRWPKNTLKVGVAGVLIHDAFVIGYITFLYWQFGWPGVVVLLGGTALGGMLGVFLVYLQHNFEDTYWDRKPDLDFRRACLQGASCVNFGWLFDEAVANITKHDIHHYAAAIPSYRLRQAHRELEGEFGFRNIGLREALRSFRLKLWDEDAGRLVPFPRD